jgi:amino acid adenylation domain-containing protein
MSTKNIEDVYPLSPMQEGLLFHTLYAPEGGLYVTQIPFNIKGLDVHAFRRAWERIIDRYATFRTAFVWKNIDRPMQVVGRRAQLSFKIEDWRDLPAAEQEARFNLYLEDDRRRGFKLNVAPLLRIVLFQTGEGAYKFLLSHHHLLIDGWSMSLVFKEALALYEAFRKGHDLDLEPTPPFKNYIAWLQKQDLKEAEVFWRNALKGFTAPTPLVVDRIPGRALSAEEIYAEEFVVLPPAVMSSLQSLVRQHQLTVNTVLQGAWALLLGRYSGQTDVAFGVVVAGRPAEVAGIELMVGLFINNLAARVRIAPERPAVGWLKEVQEQQVEVRQYEHSPLSLVQTWSEVPSGERLFDSIVSFQNFPVSDSLAEDTKGVFESIHTIETGTYPLTLMASAGNELVVSIRYDRRFFDAATAARIAGHLQILLEGIVANPQQRVSDLPLLTPSERHQILSGWNHGTSRPAPTECIHELFERQVARTPGAVAVVSGEERVTYAELNARANRLGHHLRGLGVGPEVKVGVCVERSVGMLVAVLGILKAGGAYVPLDPQYPLERLAFMLRDARTPIIVTEQRLLERLPEHRARVVCLDTDEEAISRESQDNPASGATAANLAYVIYTSGSTGTPKGALITHGDVVRLFGATQEWFKFDERDVWTLFHSYAFDFSVWEMWGALLHGGRLVVVAYWVGRSPEAFYNLLLDEEVTVLNQTPSAFRQLAAVEDSPVGVRELSLRWVIFGGEALDFQSLEPWFNHHGDERPQLVNMYGITETTVHVTYRPVTMTDVYTSQGSVIGGAIPDLQLYILDQHQQPVPIGIPGELHVGGAGLARGYLDRPALTAQKFIPHPFGDEAGARLYRSGDLARYLPNGEVEYLGRADGQVKIRGFRIELGEIEAVLSRHAGVQEVIVLALDEKEEGGKQLVAYVVAAQGQSVMPGELRARVKEHLPEYMVPAAFVMLDKFPLTQNGKLDLRALPAPGEASVEPEQTYVAPRNSIEETVALIWSQLLGVERVGVNDNFFDLGGHSIFAIQLLSRLNKAFDLELNLRVVYDMPTPATLAAAIVRTQAERPDSSELLGLLAELDNISEDEALNMLAAKPD